MAAMTQAQATLAIVVPTLNAAATLGPTLAALTAAPLVREVIVCDGGSGDATVEIARDHGARVVAAPPGRGRQLGAGAAAAGEPWLLFLHADTVLGHGWAAAAAAFMAAPDNARRAAAFRFALDAEGRAARRIEAMVAWRCRALGLPYGDQGLLISRAFYDALGGYRPLPIMEDVDLVRRVGRRRLTMLPIAATTSALRYQRGGYVRRPLRNLTCLGLFFAGLPPRLIERLYR